MKVVLQKQDVDVRASVRGGRITEEVLMKFYGKSLLLLGPPGVGKSETVRRVAERLAERKGLRFVEVASNCEVDGDVFLFYDLRLTEVEPSDFIGVPVVENGCTVFRPLKWAVLFSKHPGVIFLDELTNVNREDVVSAAYKLILEKRVGEVKLHPGVWVIAAGNTPEHSSVARTLPAPLVNRMLVIKFPVPSIKSWAKYMDEKYGEWDRRVLAYLRMFPGDFLRVPGPEALENFPTPRSWSEVALSLPRLQDDADAVSVLCRGYLGDEVGGKFLAFLKMGAPNLEDFLTRPEAFVALRVEERHLLCVALANWLKADFNRRARKALPLLRFMLSEDREMLMFLASVMGDDAAEKLFRFLYQEVGDVLVSFLEKVARIDEEPQYLRD